MIGEFKAGLQDSLGSRELYTAQGNEAAVAKAHILEGNLHFGWGDFESVLASFNEGLDMRRKLGDRKGEAGALGSIGAVFDEMKHWKEARCYHMESLDISRGLGDRIFEARTLNNLGETNLNLGNKVVAAESCDAALVIFQELGELVEQVNVHNNLGRIAHADVRYEAAKLSFARALAGGLALGLAIARAASRFYLARLLADDKSPVFSLPDAISALQAVLKETVVLEAPTLEADIKRELAAALACTG